MNANVLNPKCKRNQPTKAGLVSEAYRLAFEIPIEGLRYIEIQKNF